MINHIGLNIKEKESNFITKELYLSAKPEGMPGWSAHHYPLQIIKAGINFDANIKYFESLDYRKFEKHLNRQCKKFKFKECTDLNELNGVPGIYMLVLDKYKQVYVGISNDIRRRIKGHWNKKKSLERLIFGDICNSTLSIDSFGALDTTRVFYIRTTTLFQLEEKIVKSFDARYTLNRTDGGIGSAETYTDGVTLTKLAIVANRRTKNLVPFIDKQALINVIMQSGEITYYSRRYPELSGIFNPKDI